MAMMETHTHVDRDQNTIDFEWGDNGHAKLTLSDSDMGLYADKAVVNGKAYDSGDRRKTWIEFTGWLLIGGNSSGFQYHSAEELFNYEIDNIPEAVHEYVIASYIHALSEPDYGASVKAQIVKYLAALAGKWVHLKALVRDTLWAYDEHLSDQERTDDIDPKLYQGMVDLGDPRKDDDLVRQLAVRIGQGRDTVKAMAYLWQHRKNSHVRPALEALIKDPDAPWVSSVLEVMRDIPADKDKPEKEALGQADLLHIVQTGEDGAALRQAARSITAQADPELNGALLDIICQRLTDEATGYTPLTVLMDLIGDVEAWALLGKNAPILRHPFFRILDVIDRSAEIHRKQFSSVGVARTLIKLVRRQQKADNSVTLLIYRDRYGRQPSYGVWNWIGEQLANVNAFGTAMFDAVDDTPMGFIGFTSAMKILDGARQAAASDKPDVRNAAINFLAKQLNHEIPLVNLYADTLMRSSDDQQIRESLEGVEGVDGPMDDFKRSGYLARIRGGPGRAMRQVLPFNEDRNTAHQTQQKIEDILLSACSDEIAAVAKTAFAQLLQLQMNRWRKLAAPDRERLVHMDFAPGEGFDFFAGHTKNTIMQTLLEQWPRLPADVRKVLDELHDVLLEHMDEQPELFCDEVDIWAVTAGGYIDADAIDERIFVVEVMEDIGMAERVSIRTRAFCLSCVVNTKAWKGRRDERKSTADAVTHILASESNIQGMVELLEESGVRRLADVLIDTLQDVDNIGKIWGTALASVEQLMEHGVIPPSRYAGIIGGLDNVLSNLDEKKVSEKVVMMLCALAERDDVPGSNKERARSRLLDAAVTAERDEQLMALKALEKTRLSSRLRRRMIEDLVVLRKTEADLVGRIDKTLLAHRYSVRRDKIKKYALTAISVIAGAFAGHWVTKLDVIVARIGNLLANLF